MTTSQTLSASISNLGCRNEDSPDGSSEIEFIASHFDEMTAALFAQISFTAACSILSSPGLVLKTEDSLYEILSSRFDDDARFCELLDFVHFEYLASSSISDFVNRQHQIFEHLNPGIWDGICRRLSLGVHPATSSRRVRSGVAETYPVTSGRPLRGIIAGLSARFGGNVHEQGVVSVTASSTKSGSLSDIVDFSRETSFSTEREWSPWLMLDFRERIVNPSGYSLILTRETVKNPEAFGGFLLLVSMDGTAWTEVDNRATLFGSRDGPDVCHHAVTKSAEGRFLQISRVYDPEHSDREAALALIAWEVFGTIRMRSDHDPVAATIVKPVTTPRPVMNLAPKPAGFGPPLTGGLGRPAAAGTGGKAAVTRGDEGICADGGPLPPELNGLATFLSERHPQHVFVSSMLGAVVFHFQQLKFRGVRIVGEVLFTFGRNRIGVTHYAFAATTLRGPVDWLLDCDKIDNHWTPVDARSENDPSRAIHTVALATPIECSRLRIRLRPGQADRTLILQGFDVFGTILD
jgi:hypothetical protein